MLLTLGACARVTVLALSFVRSFFPLCCRDQRSFLHAGKVMSMITTTMACKVTRGLCCSAFVLKLWLAHLVGTYRFHLNCRTALRVRRNFKKEPTLYV